MGFFYSSKLCLPECRPHRDADWALCIAKGSVLHTWQGRWLPQTSNCQHEGVSERRYTDRYQQEVRKDTLCCTLHLVVQASFLFFVFFVCFLFFFISLWKKYLNFSTGCFSDATTLHIFSATVEKIRTVGCKYETSYYLLKEDCIYYCIYYWLSLQSPDMILLMSKPCLFHSARWLKGCSFGAR